MDITYCGRSAYWMVDIKCKDRPKLLFDTVCTLADCGYDVFHATIDSEDIYAHQEVCVAFNVVVVGFASMALTSNDMVNSPACCFCCTLFCTRSCTPAALLSSRGGHH